jgi:hypothetical protein
MAKLLEELGLGGWVTRLAQIQDGDGCERHGEHPSKFSLNVGEMNVREVKDATPVLMQGILRSLNAITKG